LKANKPNLEAKPEVEYAAKKVITGKRKRSRKRKSAIQDIDEPEPEPEPTRTIEALGPWRALVVRMY